MELRCPHCGKVLNVSIEEIAMNDRAVICPQCLGEFIAHDVDISGVVLPEKKKKAAAVPAASAFCHQCGRQLPSEDLNFCPFCGASLKLDAPVKAASGQGSARSPEEVTEDAAATAATIIKEMPYMQGYRYIPQFGSKELQPKPASLRFHLFAIFIIIVLLAIFVFIVWSGSQQ